MPNASSTATKTTTDAAEITAQLHKIMKNWIWEASAYVSEVAFHEDPK